MVQNMKDNSNKLSLFASVLFFVKVLEGGGGEFYAADGNLCFRYLC